MSESTYPQSDIISVELRGHVAIVWLDRPDKRNAMAPAFWIDFPAVMDAVGSDPAVRAIVIAAKGKSFTVGLDLMAFGPAVMSGDIAAIGGTVSPSEVAKRLNTYQQIKLMQRTFSSIADNAKPVIAAIHGHCIGAGVDLTTACDIRLAAADASFSVRETKLAMVADVGTLQRLPYIIDPGRVAELVYTGRDWDAAEALDMRYVSAVYEDAADLLEAAMEMADQIAANSPLAVQGSKAVLNAARKHRVQQDLDTVALWNAAFLYSDDLGEAITSFIEKRPPEYTGQ
ncbi:MAG: crotonase/enoyl-CoA hydratase family protein [Acidimicrobiia bacterium]|nr:crotonase/enoyl-CoA hydratase family protein [Acidimicrobiia bacterium]MDX2467359.1 crotonase/enoyl-CoA hydratase family protein [Acidimicrobiia bacterium]